MWINPGLWVCWRVDVYDIVCMVASGGELAVIVDAKDVAIHDIDHQVNIDHLEQLNRA